jgi:hypothetical protein
MVVFDNLNLTAPLVLKGAKSVFICLMNRGAERRNIMKGNQLFGNATKFKYFQIVITKIASGMELRAD